MISVGIIGGTGYTGKHLIQFCTNHNYVSEMHIYAKETAGKNLSEIFPEFECVIADSQIKAINELSYDHDIYFVSLPHGKSLEIIPSLIEQNKKVIDLGGDFRLNDAKLYTEWYNLKHHYQNLLSDKHYGLADVYSNISSNLIANPGCYPTAALLSLLPITCTFNNMIESINVNAYSGSSGAGKSLKQHLLLSELYSNVYAYNVGAHRHEPEIKQQLSNCSYNGSFTFVTHLMPVDVGIYSTSVINLKDEIHPDDIHQSYYENFHSKTFVRLRSIAPQLKWVIGSNYCDLNVTVKGKSVIVTAAIDNLIKGASGQAIQNMNLLFGFEEDAGISIKSEKSNYKVLTEGI